MSSPTENDIKKIVSQILESPEFKDSARYQELLKYLVEKTAHVSTLKETEIAQEVFGKDAKFDPSTDPLIRSYISNLRKKLEHYYLTTENELSHRLEIPRGQYLVKYTPITAPPAVKGENNTTKIWMLGIIAILCGYIIYSEFFGSGDPIIKNSSHPINPIWNEFYVNPNLPTLIILGDYLALSEKNVDKGRTFLRNPGINSEQEFKDSLKRDARKFSPYEISPVTFLGSSAPLGLHQILRAMGPAVSNVSMKLSSQVKWDDLDDQNIIFIGSFKTLYRLDTLFAKSKIQYGLNPYLLNFPSKKGDSIKTMNLDWLAGNYQKDVSVIVKLRGLKKNTILFLAGFSELGIMDAVKNAVDNDFISRVKKFSPETEESDRFIFEMISETEGVKYTVFKSEIKYFRSF